MSQDLFGVVNRPVTRVSSASRSTIGLSLVAHAAALALVVAVPLAAPILPPPYEAIEVYRQAPVIPPSVPPPAAPTRLPEAPVAVARNTVPVVAPDRIHDEMPFLVPSGAASVPPGVTCAPIAGDPGCSGGVIGGVGFTPGPAPPPVPPPSLPVRIGGQIRTPAKIQHVAPVYPAIARSTRTEGTVILEAIIAPDGSVRDLRSLRSHPLLEAAALDAVRQWRYRPTLLNGVPVAVVMTVTVTFRLE